jgi:transposase
MQQDQRAEAHRRRRIWRSTAEKRRIVELTLAPSASVARIAQAEGINANLIFKWRQAYLRGELDESTAPATSLLPVMVADTVVAPSAPSQPEPQPRTPANGAAIHIELPGRAKIAIAEGADVTMVRAILGSLRA